MIKNAADEGFALMRDKMEDKLGIRGSVWKRLTVLSSDLVEIA